MTDLNNTVDLGVYRSHGVIVPLPDEATVTAAASFFHYNGDDLEAFSDSVVEVVAGDIAEHEPDEALMRADVATVNFLLGIIKRQNS